MNFCPKCGTTIKEGAKFCRNCGHALASKSNDVMEINETKDLEDVTESFTEKSPYIKSILREKFLKNAHSKVLIAGIIIIFILIGAFVYVGKIITDPKGAVVAFQNAATKNDASSLSKILYSSDERINLTSPNVAPLLQSFKTTPSEFSDVITNLNTQAINLKNGGTENQTSNLYITKVGTTWIFFPKYEIAVKPTFLTVTSDVQGADILVNGKEIAKTDSNNFSKQLGPYIPGTYTVVGKAKGDFGDIHNETKIDFLNSNNQSNTVDALNGIYLQVSSNYDKNEVYINGKDTGKSVNSGDTVGPVASGSNVYAIASYNGSQIKSSYSNISDENKTIYFDYSKQQNASDQQKSDINNMVTGYSYALASALSSGNTTSLQQYMYPGSDLFNKQLSNVKSEYNGNFYEQYDSAVVNSFTMAQDGKSGTVDTTEVFDINENVKDYNSRAQTKIYENVYKFQYNNTTQSFQLSERVSAVEK